MASVFGRPFWASEAARYLGLWHFLEKFAPAFQEYLAGCEREPNKRTRGPDHKGAGACIASRHLGSLALGIQGHHGGLISVAGFKNWLAEREADPAVEEALTRAHEAITELEPTDPVPLPVHLNQGPRSAELFVRMLFSVLVDADYLDTERHLEPSSAEARGTTVDLPVLWDRFTADQAVA